MLRVSSAGGVSGHPNPCKLCLSLFHSAADSIACLIPVLVADTLAVVFCIPEHHSAIPSSILRSSNSKDINSSTLSTLANPHPTRIVCQSLVCYPRLPRLFNLIEKYPNSIFSCAVARKSLVLDQERYCSHPRKILSDRRHCLEPELRKS